MNNIFTSKRLIIIAGAILFALILLTVILTNTFRQEAQQEEQQAVSTLGYEGSGSVGQGKTLTLAEKKSLLNEIANQNDDNLSQDQLNKLNELKKKLPYLSADF